MRAPWERARDAVRWPTHHHPRRFGRGAIPASDGMDERQPWLVSVSSFATDPIGPWPACSPGFAPSRGPFPSRAMPGRNGRTGRPATGPCRRRQVRRGLPPETGTRHVVSPPPPDRRLRIGLCARRGPAGPEPLRRGGGLADVGPRRRLEGRDRRRARRQSPRRALRPGGQPGRASRALRHGRGLARLRAPPFGGRLAGPRGLLHRPAGPRAHGRRRRKPRRGLCDRSRQSDQRRLLRPTSSPPVRGRTRARLSLWPPASSSSPASGSAPSVSG